MEVWAMPKLAREMWHKYCLSQITNDPLYPVQCGASNEDPGALKYIMLQMNAIGDVRAENAGKAGFGWTWHR
jgi:hypothetical protein